MKNYCGLLPRQKRRLMAKFSDVSRVWFQAMPWERVVAMNEQLCAARSALHNSTSASGAVAEAWQERQHREMTFRKAVDLLRWCHQAAPFCFFNGNTFAAIALTLLGKLEASPAEGAALRSAVGHYVAGVLGVAEFAQMMETLDHNS